MLKDVLIIGAGIYGISIANALEQTGLSFAVTGNYMDLWYHHTFNEMSLRSDFKLSEIYDPENKYSVENFISRFPEYQAFQGVHLPVIVFRKYLDWIKKSLPYDIISSNVKTLDFEEKPGRFKATLQDDREINAKRVIIAAGLSYYKNIPVEFSSPGKKVYHSYDTEKISGLKNLDVLVVGSGQSAAECVENLTQNNNRISRLQRHRPVFLEQPVNIPLWLFKLIEKSGKLFFYLPGFLKTGLNQLLSKPTVMPSYRKFLDSTYLIEKNNGSNNYDVVVCACGFKFNLKNLEFLSGSIIKKLEKKSLTKIVNRNFETSVPGLFFAGPITGFTFGPSMKFIIGARFASQRVTRILARTINKAK